MTPGLAAGVPYATWSIRELVTLVDAFGTVQPRKRPGISRS